MLVTPLKEYKAKNVNELLSRNSLFSELDNTSPTQYRNILADAEVLEMENGEAIVKKGEECSRFYVLIDGEIDVFGGEDVGPSAIEQLKPGQLFGTLGALTCSPRTATLTASRQGGAVLLKFDFVDFGDLEDFSVISLATKLKLYRNVITATRWRLEMLRRNGGDDRMSQELEMVPVYCGEPGHVDELHSLQKQAAILASILDEWNEMAEPTIELPAVAEPETGFGSIIRGFFGKSAS